MVKGHQKETHKNWLLNTGDPSAQVHLHCTLDKKIPERCV